MAAHTKCIVLQYNVACAPVCSRVAHLKHAHRKSWQNNMHAICMTLVWGLDPSGLPRRCEASGFLLQEKQGDVLVFMSTAAAVNELVQAVQQALAHDPACSVLGLYADMNDDEIARVTGFHDLSKFPQNMKKRLICIATDIAESGVPIPGRTSIQDAVVSARVPTKPVCQQNYFCCPRRPLLLSHSCSQPPCCIQYTF